MVDFFNICQKIGKHLDMLLRLGGRGRAGITILFIAGLGSFFHFRGRGWAGIKNFEMTGAGAEPGLEKIGNAEAGPGLEVI